MENTGEQMKKPIIFVEAVDADDRLYSFFIGWLLELQRQGIVAIVVCLRKGRIPHMNHEVIQLPDKGSLFKLRRALRVIQLTWSLRYRYDSVFIRGSCNYILVAGILMRLMRKRIIFWYAHYTHGIAQEIAACLSNVVVTSVKEACQFRVKRPIEIGQSIDTDLFKPSENKTYVWNRCIVLGRVMPVKKVKEAIQTFIDSDIYKDPQSELVIVGRGKGEAYDDEIHNLCKQYDRVSWMEDGMPYEELPELLCRFDFIFNFYQGSLDKTILEGMASGLIPIISTEAAEGLLPTEFHWMIARDEKARIGAFDRANRLNSQERKAILERLRQIVQQKHSLVSQVHSVIKLL